MSELRYGDNRTIHGTNHLDIETDEDGNVVSVWFRCMMLPFKQTKVRKDRAEDMRRAYEGGMDPLLAVVVERR